MSFTLNNVIVVSAVSFIGLLALLVFMVKFKNEQEMLNQKLIERVNSLTEANKKTTITTSDIMRLTEKLTDESSKLKSKIARVSNPQPSKTKVPLKQQPYISEIVESEESEVEIEVEDLEDEEEALLKAVNSL